MKREVNYFRVSLLAFTIFTIIYVAHQQNDSNTGRHNHKAAPGSSRTRRSAAPEPVAYPVLCPEVKPISAFKEVKGWEEWNIDQNFYQKFAGIPNVEIPVFGSEQVSDTSIQEAYNLVVRLTAHLRADVLTAFLGNKVRVIVLGAEEKTLQIPEFKSGQSQDAERILITTEPNLLCLYKDANRGESFLARSLADAVRERMELIDPTFRRRLKTMFSDAVEKELYKDNEEINSPSSYWTESVKNFFGANLAAYKICTRVGLLEYDPEMEKTIRSIFGETPYVHICPLVDGTGKLEGCGKVAVRREPPPLVAVPLGGPVDDVPPPRGHAHAENVVGQRAEAKESGLNDCVPGKIKCVGEDNPSMYFDCVEAGKWSFKEAPDGQVCIKDGSGISRLGKPKAPLTPRDDRN